MKRLSMATAAHLLPYDRRKVTPGMVHLGVGAFHRAHVADYVDSILPAEPDWGIIGASLRRSDTRLALKDQDFLYTLATRSAEGTKTRVIGSLLDVLDASTQRAELLAAMADPRIRIVSLTVTEKGYCHDPATGKLDPRHADIVHDLAHPEAPISAPGLIVRALELRKAQGTPPFAIMSCDNLPANGATTARIVCGFANLRSPELGAFIRDHVAFPSTMIDRIVPATTDDDRKMVQSETGLEDAWPVVTEPFKQWVIEDRFNSGRPAFGSVGAELVDDVAPYELMKLRMLNGSHSTLAYLGYLAGYEYVSDVVTNQDFRSLAHRLMTLEAIPTLSMGAGELGNYRDQLLQRFANPALKHRTWQIAMDGSQKLPQRLLGTIRDLLKIGITPRYSAMGVAAWMRYVSGEDEYGRPIDVRDPLAERMKSIAVSAGRDAEGLVSGLLSINEVFGSDLSQSAVLKNILIDYVSNLLRDGSKATVHRLIES
jgi:fructuronate reductase